MNLLTGPKTDRCEVGEPISNKGRGDNGGYILL
jgi:hypothetical protein